MAAWKFSFPTARSSELKIIGRTSPGGSGLVARDVGARCPRAFPAVSGSNHASWNSIRRPLAGGHVGRQGDHRVAHRHRGMAAGAVFRGRVADAPGPVLQLLDVAAADAAGGTRTAGLRLRRRSAPGNLDLARRRRARRWPACPWSGRRPSRRKPCSRRARFPRAPDSTPAPSPGSASAWCRRPSRRSRRSCCR